MISSVFEILPRTTHYTVGELEPKTDSYIAKDTFAFGVEWQSQRRRWRFLFYLDLV